MFILTIFFIVILILIYFKNRGVPMFLYHQVNDVSNVTPELFEEHLKILSKKNINTITISQYGEKNIPKNSFIISLDDGYYDNYLYVFPLLKKYNMKATIFLNTLFIEDKREGKTTPQISGVANYEAMKEYDEKGNGKSAQYMSWEEIREMHKSGLVDFQAHSHKHTPVFVSDKLEGFFEGTERDMTDVYLYGDVKKGYPKFPKRGEYSTKGILIDRKFFEIFKRYYDEVLENLDEKERLKLGQEFVDRHKKDYFKYEDDRDYRGRVLEDYRQNRLLIEKNLGYIPKFFCWPWGHRSIQGKEILKDEGIIGFVTTKKGTNGKNNLEMIRRVELRKFTPQKFKLNLFITQNYILGKIYGWLS